MRKYEIIPALGEFAADFDLDAIADGAFELTADYNGDGVQTGNAYYVEREGVDFWDVVESADISGIQKN